MKEDDVSFGVLLLVLGICFFVMGLALKFVRSAEPPAAVRPDWTQRPKPVMEPATAAKLQQQVRAIRLTDTCPICLCLYGEGVSISVLPCGHGLHEQCWASMVEGAVAVSCPLCREPLL